MLWIELESKSTTFSELEALSEFSLSLKSTPSGDFKHRTRSLGGGSARCGWQKCIFFFFGRREKPFGSLFFGRALSLRRPSKAPWEWVRNVSGATESTFIEKRRDSSMECGREDTAKWPGRRHQRVHGGRSEAQKNIPSALYALSSSSGSNCDVIRLFLLQAFHFRAVFSARRAKKRV